MNTTQIFGLDCNSSKFKYSKTIIEEKSRRVFVALHQQSGVEWREIERIVWQNAKLAQVELTSGDTTTLSPDSEVMIAMLEDEPTSFFLGYMKDEQAEALQRKLNGQSYMDFRVDWGRSPAGAEVSISTKYDAPEKEIAEMIMYLLATQ